MITTPIEKKCDPCRFCQNATYRYDNSTGISDEGCLAGEDFDYIISEDKCQSFKPFLVSDGLYEQLFNEDQARDLQ